MKEIFICLGAVIAAAGLLCLLGWVVLKAIEKLIIWIMFDGEDF